jgi:hypothetical protein
MSGSVRGPRAITAHVKNVRLHEIGVGTGLNEKCKAVQSGRAILILLVRLCPVLNERDVLCNLSHAQTRGRDRYLRGVFDVL